MNSELLRRILVIVAGIPIVVYLCWLGGWPFVSAISVISALTAWESMRLLGPFTLRRTGYVLAVSLTALLPAMVFVVGMVALLWALLAGLLLAGSFAVTRSPADGSRFFVSVLFTQLYVGLPFLTLLLLRIDPVWGTPYYATAIVVYILAGVWVGDTAAFLIGRRFGKRKLAPAISPGKTVEGAIAGTVAALMWALLAGRILDQWLLWWDMLAMGLILALFSIVGDLAESLLKRVALVKDSSNILPGHGGMLDRADALLFAIPAAYLYLLSVGVVTIPF